MKRMPDNAIKRLEDKARWVRKETISIHGLAPETRLASSLSCVEILSVLFYAPIISFDPHDTSSARRDRLVISKAHGAISFLPILADLDFIDKSELEKVCKQGSRLGSIPDMLVPGFETINGSLGHGPGTACGIALALKRQKLEGTVFVLLGDGELYEGSVWEAVMFAGEHKLDNLVLVLDNNKACMLDFCRNIIDLEPLEGKFRAFKWASLRIDGHDVNSLYHALLKLKQERAGQPKLLVADTIKGKGVPELEIDPLSHIKMLPAERVSELIKELK